MLSFYNPIFEVATWLFRLAYSLKVVISYANSKHFLNSKSHGGQENIAEEQKERQTKKTEIHTDHS
jgi:hypothetical protein